MDTFNSFKDVIEAWPSVEAFADDTGVSANLVSVWKHRDTLPNRVWAEVVAGAEAREIEGVTYATLVAIAAAKKKAA